MVISGSADKTVRVWDLATGNQVGAPLLGHTNAVQVVATAQLDGRPVVISGSADKTVRMWDLPTGTPVGNPLSGHADSAAWCCRSGACGCGGCQSAHQSRGECDFPRWLT